jgi:hypothetical protein
MHLKTHLNNHRQEKEDVLPRLEETTSSLLLNMLALPVLVAGLKAHAELQAPDWNGWFLIV